MHKKAVKIEQKFYRFFIGKFKKNLLFKREHAKIGDVALKAMIREVAPGTAGISGE